MADQQIPHRPKRKIERLLLPAALEVLVCHTVAPELALCHAQPAEHVRIIRRIVQCVGEQFRHLLPATFVAELERGV